MNILLLKGFNNYFNRTVKKYSTLADYKTNSASYLDFSSINFNPNDGISTELIIGNATQQENSKPLDWENLGTPDYLVCYENEGNPAAPVIKFRWFILESERTRKGQFRLALKRDVIAEHFSEIINAPCFVEKGNISNASNPLLFNKEAGGVNQIKQSEILLKDNTNCAWIVGYVSQDKHAYGPYESSSTAAAIESYSDMPQLLKTIEATGFVQMPYPTLNTTSSEAAGRCRMTVKWGPKVNSTNVVQLITFTNVPWVGEVQVLSTSQTGDYVLGNTNNNYNVTMTANTFPMYYGFHSGTTPTYHNSGAANMMRNIRWNSTLRGYYINNKLTNGIETLSAADLETIRQWDGRYVTKDGQVYKVNTTIWSRQMGPDWSIKYNTSDANYNALYTEISTLLNNSDNQDNTFFRQTGSTALNGDIEVQDVTFRAGGTQGVTEICKLAWEYQQIEVTLTLAEAGAGSTINSYIPAGRNQCSDTPMDIFAIPYSDDFEVITARDAETGDPTQLFHTSKEISLQAAMTLAQAGSVVYDIQILPYFPSRGIIGDSDADIAEGKIFDNTVDLSSGTILTQDKDFNYILNADDAKIGVIFWSKESTFTFDIPVNLSLASTDALSLKLSNECDLYRLCAPNYSSGFEFSLAKTGGAITKVNIDCTYKPFDPYIHVAPDLTGLYGENFLNIDDSRGLIVGGDYSISRYTDAWAQYELQNKNYQAIFNRQIQNIDTNNEIAMEKANFNGIVGMLGGIFGGGVGGAMAGSKAGPYGAIAGAVLGTGFSTAVSELSYMNNMDWLRRQQEEAKSYTQDMYVYNLGNVKALPNGLAKTNAITNNNKLFPLIEYYTCTEVERNAVYNRIKYNGMTIMVVDTLSNYIESSDFDRVYVKGQLVRLETVNDDFHIIDAIYQEVNKGFFVKQ